MGKIFCFINGGSSGWYEVVAISENGYHLAGHISSCKSWAKHDIGIGSDWKHDKYKKHYPDGYELVWIDEPENSKELDLAFQKYDELGEVAQLSKEEKPGVTITYSE